MAKDTATFIPLGQGVTYAVTDNALVLHIAMDAAAIAGAEPSKSGKTKLLASTGGFIPVPGTPGLKVGLNVTAPK